MSTEEIPCAMPSVSYTHLNELIGKTGVIGSVNDIVGSVFDGASTIIESKEIAKYYETCLLYTSRCV